MSDRQSGDGGGDASSIVVVEVQREPAALQHKRTSFAPSHTATSTATCLPTSSQSQQAISIGGGGDTTLRAGRDRAVGTHMILQRSPRMVVLFDLRKRLRLVF
jgi:hypothetical protein